MPKYTDAQIQRLSEYGNEPISDEDFADASIRDKTFTKAMSKAQTSNERGLQKIIAEPEANSLSALIERVSAALIADGFIEVRCPIMITEKDLAKMTITRDNPMFKQVFWLAEGRALRPMLAPGLYKVMKHLRGHTDGPVKIFEVGPCFRKESHSGMHLEQFTMLNLVDMGSQGDPKEKLKHYIEVVMEAAELPDYELRMEDSDVYGWEFDVEVGGQEVCSTGIGPHKLDPAHGVDEPWAGAGFGMERLLSIKNGLSGIRKAGASTSYLNGYRIN